MSEEQADIIDGLIIEISQKDETITRLEQELAKIRGYKKKYALALISMAGWKKELASRDAALEAAQKILETGRVVMVGEAVLVIKKALESDSKAEKAETLESILSDPAEDIWDGEYFLDEYVKMAQVCIEKDGLEQSLSYMRMKSALKTIAACPIHAKKAEKAVCGRK